MTRTQCQKIIDDIEPLLPPTHYATEGCFLSLASASASPSHVVIMMRQDETGPRFDSIHKLPTQAERIAERKAFLQERIAKAVEISILLKERGYAVTQDSTELYIKQPK